MRVRPQNTDHELVIAESERGLWIVVYQGRPVQVRREQLYRDDIKYLPMSWTQRGGAERQARRLNQVFGTDQFEIASIDGNTPDD